MKQKLPILITFFTSLVSILFIPAILSLPLSLITTICLFYWKKCNRNIIQEDFKIINIYFFWAFVCIIRGFLIAENYTEYRQNIFAIPCCLLPIIIWLAYYPDIVSKIFRFWYKYLLILTPFILLREVNVTYLAPLMLFICFLPLYKNKKTVIIFLILGILYFYISSLYSMRVYVIKIFTSFLFAFGILFLKRLIKTQAKLIGILAYSCVIFIFTLTLVGCYNIFIQGESSEEVLNEYKQADPTGNNDTRSLIIIDVINSAIQNNYTLLGRTPARGNDIEYSGIYFYWAYEDGANSKSFNKGERHYNEAGFLNIFTWEGLIGLVLYSLIYIKATILAIKKSNNIYIKCLGCLIGFYWSIGFVETINLLDSSNLTLWIMIGMCYSIKFRKMNDIEFKNWAQTLIQPTIKSIKSHI